MAITESEGKIIQFLEDELLNLKEASQEGAYNRSKQRRINKRCQTLSLRIESVLKITPLSPDALQTIYLIQKEIKGYLS